MPGRQFMQIMLPSIQVEFMYALIASIIFLLIYFQTREFYELTKHKGIKYFRNAFLFLAIAHVIRFVTNFFLLTEMAPMKGFNTIKLLAIIGFSLATFVSSLGILSLAYSSVHKKIQKGFFSKNYSLYIIAASMFVLTVFFQEAEFFVITQIILLAFAFTMSTISLDKSVRRKRKNKMTILYGLFFIFWLIGIFASNINPIYLGLKIISYAVAISIISIILYKVIQKTSTRKTS